MRRCSSGSKRGRRLQMRALSIQMQPARASELDPAAATDFLTQRATRIERGVQVRVSEGFDKGRYINVDYVTEDVAQLWDRLRREVLADSRIGPAFAQCSIIVCQGETGWDD